MAEGETLNLCDQNLTEVPLAVIQQRGSRVTTLNFSENALQAPGNVHLLPALHTLILDKNGLTTLAGFKRAESVTTLWFNNNAVDDLPEFCDHVAALFPRVSYLSFMRNPASPALICASEEDAAAALRYRLYVIHRLPGLQFLDASPVTPGERKDAKAKGQYMVVRKPKAAIGGAGAAARAPGGASASAFGAFGGEGGGDAASPAAAAAAAAAEAERRKPSSYLALGTSKYDGRHSEGNRFIQDTHL